MDFYIKTLFWWKEIYFLGRLEHGLTHLVKWGLESKLENVALHDFSVKVNFTLDLL